MSKQNHDRKKQLQKRYALQFWQSRKVAQKTQQRTEEIRRSVVHFAKKHSKAGMIILSVAVLLAMLLGGLSSCAMMVGSGISGMFSATYTAADSVMLGAEAAYCTMETALQRQINDIKIAYPDYDHYEYDLDEIGHDPYVLISILSVLHGGEFTLDFVQYDLSLLFENQYNLTLRKSSIAVWVGNGYQIETILHVTLDNIGMDRLPSILLTEEQLSSYAAYMSTLGNRKDLFAGVPGASTLKEPEYYEIPPEALEDAAFAAMITEGEKYLGYPYVWGGSSPSTSFDCSGFVCWVYTASGVHNLPRTTAQGIYNQCAIISPSEAKPGDIIFFTGTYDSPGPVSHVGIYVGDGMMLHCGSVRPDRTEVEVDERRAA